jgi:hypothetical protein
MSRASHSRIIRDGKLDRATGFGFANLAQPRSMRADTLINVGSVTKTATCIAVMQLWERRSSRWMDGREYLAVVSCEELRVSRSAGHIPAAVDATPHRSPTVLPMPGATLAGTRVFPLGQWLRDYLTASGALLRPAAQFSLLEARHAVRVQQRRVRIAGHLVETLSGMSYSDYMLNRVFAPLGMSRSRILLAGMDPQSHATPYSYTNGGDVAAVELRDPMWTRPADRPDGVQVPHCLYSFGTPPDGLAGPLPSNCHACCGL